MHIQFIAFESLGVRSQATFIQTKEYTIFIDPSAALAPSRYGLPPHVAEVEKLLEIFDKIEELIKDSDILIFTHYHYDHHDPGRFIDPILYKDKIIFIKDPRNNINVSQRIRASRFLKVLVGNAKALHIADGASISMGNTTIRFSNPLPHGESSNLGYVVAICIADDDKTILYTSDIEGGPKENHKELLDLCKADIAVIDGPPIYLLGYKYSENSLRLSIEFIISLLNLESIKLIVLDHHLCREIGYKEKLAQIFEKAEMLGKHIKTAAEFMGLKPLFLEAMRRNLYKDNPENGLKLLKSRLMISKDLGDKDIGEIFGDG